MNLYELGWNPERENAFREMGLEHVSPGRIIADDGHKYRVATERGEGWAEMSGCLQFEFINADKNLAGREEAPSRLSVLVRLSFFRLKRQPFQHVLNLRIPIAPLVGTGSFLIGKRQTGAGASIAERLVILVQEIFRAAALV